MQKVSAIFGIVSLSLILLSNTLIGGSSSDARINTYKQELKQAIKPARYEGSRVTYYAPSNENQVKNIELFTILDTEYKFAFSGKECTTDVSVKFYDSNDETKRTLLKEVNNIKGKNIVVSSKELTKNFHKKVNKNERLKVVFIEYQIAGGNKQLEAVVLVVGYKD